MPLRASAAGRGRAAWMRRGRARIVRADRDDRALDGVGSRRSRTSTCAPASWLERGGHDEQPVGAHERGRHAGAARSGVATSPPPTRPSRTRIQSSSRARTPSRAAAPALTGPQGPLPPGRRAAERESRTSARRRPDSLARRAPRFRSLCRVRRGGGLDGDACWQCARLGDDGGGVVVPAVARAAILSEVGSVGGRFRRRSDRAGSSGAQQRPTLQSASRASREHQPVGVDELAKGIGAERAPRRRSGSRSRSPPDQPRLTLTGGHSRGGAGDPPAAAARWRRGPRRSCARAATGRPRRAPRARRPPSARARA